jgi:hypothetical protein
VGLIGLGSLGQRGWLSACCCDAVLCTHHSSVLGESVWLKPVTEAEPDDRTWQRVKPKPKPKTEKTDISVRFGSVSGFKMLSLSLDVPN